MYGIASRLFHSSWEKAIINAPSVMESVMAWSFIIPFPCVAARSATLLWGTYIHSHSYTYVVNGFPFASDFKDADTNLPLTTSLFHSTKVVFSYSVVILPLYLILSGKRKLFLPYNILSVNNKSQPAWFRNELKSNVLAAPWFRGTGVNTQSDSLFTHCLIKRLNWWR